MSSIVGKMLLLLGGLIAVAGALLLVASRWLDRSGRLLPGDFLWRRGDVSFFFPVGTCVVASIVLSLLMTLAFYLAGHWRH